MLINVKSMKTMKKILKISLLSIAGTFLLNACDNEDYIKEVPKGAMIYLSQEAQDDGFINALDLSDVMLNFTLSTTDRRGQNLEFAPIASMDVTVTYTNSADGSIHKAILENITAWPKTYTLSADDIVDIFPENVVNMNSVNVGDNFQISADFHMQDGTFLSGWSPALLDKSPASVYSVIIDYPVACASSIPVGTYSAVSSGTSTDPCCTAPLVDFPFEITITSPAPGTYTVDDIYAGVYLEWYDVYGITTREAQAFTDICNNLTATFDDPFGGGVTMEGTYDPATNTITFKGSNTFGDAWSTVWTPK
jgi:hypothetical protein